jgi:threonine aldolase
VENTHNGGGGSVWPLEEIRAVCDVGRAYGLATHMDGARLWHAAAASGTSEREYADSCDTVSVCFSKGLGAPVGSALAGPGQLIERARRFRQMFGGGMRQAGVLAAAALYALENHRDGLAADIQNTSILAEGLARLDGVVLDLATVQSNIVRFTVTGISAGRFALLCHERGVHMLPAGERGARAVVHRDVTAEDVSAAIDVIDSVLSESRTPEQMSLSDA